MCVPQEPLDYLLQDSSRFLPSFYGQGKLYSLIVSWVGEILDIDKAPTYACAFTSNLIFKWYK